MDSAFNSDQQALSKLLSDDAVEQIEESAAEGLADDARRLGLDETSSIELTVSGAEAFPVDNDRVHDLADRMIRDDPDGTGVDHESPGADSH